MKMNSLDLKDENINVNERVVFTLSFLALLFSMSSYQKYLEKVMFNVYTYTFSLYHFLIILEFALFLSIYFSAIDNVKYTNVKLIKWKPFQYCSLLSDLVYFFAILVIPFFLLMLWFTSFFSSIVQRLLNYNVEVFLYSLTALVSIILALIFATIVTSHYRENKISEIQKAAEIEDNSLLKATEYCNNKNYSSMVYELYNAIIYKLFVKLSEKYNIKRQQIQPAKLIELAISVKLINKSQEDIINRIESFRNKFTVGNSFSLDEIEAQGLFKVTKEMLESI